MHCSTPSAFIHQYSGVIPQLSLHPFVRLP
uniref:Uncharacterized protein n=1 Tax=Anguilla anguilla TaxID=7936 RepID=A0A0E9PCR2_ANGAN